MAGRVESGSGMTDYQTIGQELRTFWPGMEHPGHYITQSCPHSCNAHRKHPVYWAEFCFVLYLLPVSVLQ